MIKKPIGVFISGRGSNLESIINACKDENFPAKVVCVFSDNANAAGLQFASKNNIDTHTLDLNNFESKSHYEEEILKILKPYNIELICLAGYMKILPEYITDEFRGKILNIHPSLLPKHKGLNTHKKVLESNDSSHGASVHFVNSELDGGAVIIQGQVNVKRDDTEETLKEKVHKIEYEIYPIAIKWFIEKHIELKNDKCLFDGEVLECPIEHIL